MTKAVFDTTVLVAALLTPKGLARALIARARRQEFELCLSLEILAETQTRLIRHKHLRQRYAYTDEEVAYFISGLRYLATPVYDLPLVQVVRDPNDDFILATALKAGADYLVSRDQDLLVLRTHQNIQIVTPEAFWQILSESVQG
jgi:putative PIN family toxin of toxin-antitoxin system